MNLPHHLGKPPISSIVGSLQNQEGTMVYFSYPPTTRRVRLHAPGQIQEQQIPFPHQVIMVLMHLLRYPQSGGPYRPATIGGDHPVVFTGFSQQDIDLDTPLYAGLGHVDRDRPIVCVHYQLKGCVDRDPFKVARRLVDLYFGTSFAEPQQRNLPRLANNSFGTIRTITRNHLGDQHELL